MNHNQNNPSYQEPLLAEFRRYLAEPGPWTARFSRFAETISVSDQSEAVSSPSAITEVAALTCDACQELLDVYIDDELTGVNVRHTYPAVWEHLSTCAECQEVHQLLLDVLAPEGVPEALPPLPEAAQAVSATLQKPPSEPSDKTPWSTRLWQSLVGDAFRLEFVFNLAYLRTLLLPQPLVLRDGPTMQPKTHLLLYNTVSVAEQILTVEVTATRHEADNLILQALVSGTSPLPSHLQAVLTWVDQSHSVTVDAQGRAELGQVPLGSLQTEAGHFGLALVSRDKVNLQSKEG